VLGANGKIMQMEGGKSAGRRISDVLV